MSKKKKKTLKNGSREKKKTLKNVSPENNVKTSNDSDSLTKIFYISLIYILFILGGIFEEKIYKTQYPINNTSNKTIKFHDAKVSLFLISIISSILSYVGIMIKYFII